MLYFEKRTTWLIVDEIETTERPIEIRINDHSAKGPAISCIKYKSPLQPVRKPIVSPTTSNAGLRHRSMKTKPTKIGFPENLRLKTAIATTKQTISRRYGKAEEVNCCHL